METDAVLRLRSALTAYLAEFRSCMGKRTNVAHLHTYVEGQLGPLARKSVEPIALAAGTPPRTLQEFLSVFQWDHERLRDMHQRRVARRHHHDGAIGIIDGTSFVKKGTKTPCVQRQWCGRVGKVENCVVSVHLGYATPTFHTLLDGDLFLPETTWHEDRERCREAGIPDHVVYRSKGRIALDQLRRARDNGVHLAWLTFDEEFGGKPWFLHALDGMGQRYVAELPRDFRVWTKEPRCRLRSHPCDSQRSCDGESPQSRPLMVQTNPTITVQNVLGYSPKLRDARWEQFVVNDSTTGPLVWAAVRLPVWLPDEDGQPTRPMHLIITKSVLIKSEIKFFLSNAPEATKLEDLLFVAFSRWRIERLFEDSKGELGLHHFESRTFVSVQRHLILSSVSHAFMAEVKELECSKSASAHREPGARRGEAADSALDRATALLSCVG